MNKPKITREKLISDILDTYGKIETNRYFNEPRERYTPAKLKRMTRAELQLHLAEMVLSKTI